MAASTSLTDTSHMRQFETMIISMPPEVRAKYIDDYLDWLWEKAWNLGTAPEKERSARLMNLVDIFVLGKKEADKSLLEEIQEAATILVYIIGDVGEESPLVRLDRAQKRRVKLLNLWRAFLGVEPLALPTIPVLESEGLEPSEPEVPVVESPKLEDYTSEDSEKPEADDEVEDKGQG